VAPHVPREEPSARMQGRPGQQSAVVEQPPPVPTQMPPQMKAGRLGPTVGLGAHASPQQSALLAHAFPACEPPSAQASPPIVHLGIPRRSCWHTNGFLLTFPAQQLFSALQEPVASLHTAPAGRHELPLSHRPTRSVGLPLLQLPTPVTPFSPLNPQQSESPRQISPVGRQPLGG